MVGNITQPNDHPKGVNSRIYLLDIRNYTWIYSFEPTSNQPSNPPTTGANPQPPTNTSESNDQLTTMRVVIATLGGTVGTVILMAIGFFGYKRYQRNQREGQDEVLRVYGNHGNTY